MPSKIGQYNFPKRGKVFPTGSKVKPQRIRPIKQGITEPQKPAKVGVKSFPKPTLAKPPKIAAARRIPTTTKAR